MPCKQANFLWLWPSLECRDNVMSLPVAACAVPAELDDLSLLSPAVVVLRVGRAGEGAEGRRDLLGEKGVTTTLSVTVLKQIVQSHRLGKAHYTSTCVWTKTTK